MGGEKHPRSRWRRIATRLFVLVIAGGQIFFIVRAYEDPHVHFGYQPFNESSTWQAEIYRVTERGHRISCRNGWFGYRWEELVRDRVGWPWQLGHADSGVDSTMIFMQEALDWVADHTPDDTESVYLEADFTYYRNTRGPIQRLFRSKTRDLEGLRASGAQR